MTTAKHAEEEPKPAKSHTDAHAHADPKHPKGAKAPEDHAVAASDAGIDPARVEIKAGDSVTWTNKGNSKHSFKFTTAPEGADLPAPTGNILSGKSATITFTKPGSYEYGCESHPAIRGTVVVS